MKHTKLVALFMAIVMTMGLMTTAASACTADKDGNITPCEQVEEDGYCDIEWLRGIDWEAGVMYQWNNPYYKASGKNPAVLDPTKGVSGGTTEIGDDTQVIPDRPLNPIPEETDQPVETQKPTQYFPDVADDAWYAEAVNTMAANGILNGYPDGNFHPEDNVTTGELCAIIYRLGKNENPVNKPVPDHPEYTHWASYAVWFLRTRTLGYTTCRPDEAAEFANRGEAVQAIIALIRDDNGAHRLQRDYTRIHDWYYENNDIPDWDEIDAGAGTRGHNWVNWYIIDAYNYGIVSGVDSTGRFNPNGTLTRAELAQMLYNAKLTKYTPAPMREKGSTQGIVVGG